VSKNGVKESPIDTLEIYLIGDGKLQKELRNPKT
jgi:hypothetical protein